MVHCMKNIINQHYNMKKSLCRKCSMRNRTSCDTEKCDGFYLEILSTEVSRMIWQSCNDLVRMQISRDHALAVWERISLHQHGGSGEHVII